MSSAFVREGDHLELSDISPTLTSLISFLTHENGGIRVYEKRRMTGLGAKTLHEMSNGLTYAINTGNRWEVIM
jgi:hypothetical protein